MNVNGFKKWISFALILNGLVLTSEYAIADTPPPSAKEQTAAPTADAASNATATPPAETEGPAPVAAETVAPSPAPAVAEAPAASGEASTTEPSMVGTD